MLIDQNIKFKEYDNPTEIAANDILKGKITAWFNGRMEFGPRALGARSILADPRSKNMKIDKQKLNLEKNSTILSVCFFENTNKFYEENFILLWRM